MSNVERMARRLCDVMNPGPFECCGQCADARKIAATALACAREIVGEATRLVYARLASNAPACLCGNGRVPVTSYRIAVDATEAAALAALTPEEK